MGLNCEALKVEVEVEVPVEVESEVNLDDTLICDDRLELER